MIVIFFFSINLWSVQMSENTKKIIGPLQKETTNFSKYYELIKSGNNDYMNNVKKLYQLKGYKKNDEYKNNEKIFDSSFLLDKKYGKDQQNDSNKYPSINYNFYNDKKILDKLNNFLERFQKLKLKIFRGFVFI